MVVYAMRIRLDCKVSVIIPTWNRAATIEQAVRSSLAQTVSSLEVLVCDDGSSDNTKHIVDSIDDERIIWIPGPHSGVPAIPRNRGIRESKGEWLAFLDSDDEWLPDKLEKQLVLAQRLGCKAACSNATRHVPGEGFKGAYLAWKKEKITFDSLLPVNLVICSSAIIHKSLFATVVGFSEDERLKAREDYALWLRVATQTDFAYHPEPLVMYRDDAANSVRSEETSPWKQRNAVFNDFRNWRTEQNISASFLRKIQQQAFIDIVHSKIIKIRNTCTLRSIS